jgi:hypothetical protein
VTQKLYSFFKVAKKSKQMSFGKKVPLNFNYVDFADPDNIYLGNTTALHKQMNDSYQLEINVDGEYKLPISELKLTNQDILTWEDYWIDAKTNTLIDPRIERINLQKNKLVHANFSLPRSVLKSVNLEGNLNLRGVFVHNAPQLEVLNFSNCPALDVVNLGNNKSLKALLAKNCSMRSSVQEALLRDFCPIVTSTSNRPFDMFRKSYETLVDMRGSQIDWGNRKIASKIRLLLCNNWLVLWDNPPPTSIIPPQMYAFFSANLSDSLIKDYYYG